MSDVLDDLRGYFPDRVPDMGAANYDTLESLINRAIAEITYLRSIAGAVSDGMSAADIKAELYGRASGAAD